MLKHTEACVFQWIIASKCNYLRLSDKQTCIGLNSKVFNLYTVHFKHTYIYTHLKLFSAEKFNKLWLEKQK